MLHYQKFFHIQKTLVYTEMYLNKGNNLMRDIGPSLN